MCGIDSSSAYATNTNVSKDVDDTNSLFKPKLKSKTSIYRIEPIEDIIERNYKAPIDPYNNCTFVVKRDKQMSSMTIPTEVYKMLRCVYLTVGRFPVEMEAICFLQMFLVQNITQLSSAEIAVSKLKSIPPKTPTMSNIIKKLVNLCEQEI